MISPRASFSTAAILAVYAFASIAPVVQAASLGTTKRASGAQAAAPSAAKKASTQLDPLPPSDGSEWKEPKSGPLLGQIWVDSHGETQKQEKWASKTEWIWTGESAMPPKPKLRARLWLQVPAQEKLLSVEGPPETVSHPISGTPFSGEVIAVDLDRPELTVAVTTQLRKDVSKEKIHRTLVLSFGQSFTAFLIHPDCRKAGLKIYRRSGAVKAPYVGAWCQQGEKGHFEILLSYLGNQVPRASGNLQQASSPEGAFVAVVSSAESSRTAYMGTLKLENLETTVYFRNPESKFHSSFALQGSYIHYLEPANQIALTELGLTGKVAASYSISKRFDVSASAFMTLLPITLSPPGLPPARFWGFNGRVGVALPHPGFMRVGMSLGYYLLGLQSSGPYGINLASGPQIFLTFASVREARRESFAYLKYALLESGSLSFGSRELAVGGGYQLATIADRPLSGVIDVSQADFASPDGLSTFSWISISGGLQLSL